MKPVDRPPLPESAQWVHAGLVLGALFGWILSFPMFGPLLMRDGGASAPLLGLLFLFSHGAGLLTLHLLPAGVGLNPSVVRSVGALVTLATILFTALVWLPGALFIVMIALGFLSAYLVLAWTPLLTQSAQPLASLMVAMATANLVAALVNLPLPDDTSFVWGLLALLPLWSAYSIASTPDLAEGRPAPPPQPLSLREAVLPLAAFALADYFVGGIWYQAAIATSVDGGVWRPVFESLLSAAGVYLFYLRVRNDRPSTLVHYCLSLLGLGLLMAAAGPAGPLGVIAYRSLLLLGLVAGDLFYWHQLWVLGATLGVRRTMGVGLGVSLWLIGAANLITGEPGSVLPVRLFLLIGASLLFLAIPLIFRSPSLGKNRRKGEATTAGTLLPWRLTDTERQVYTLLIGGAADQEIADRLFISKHTVKFHVRNILHKAGAANRRDLLARLLVGQPSAPSRKESVE